MRDRDFFELEDRVRDLTRRVKALEEAVASPAGTAVPEVCGTCGGTKRVDNPDRQHLGDPHRPG